jgi:hypothetical protein
VTPRPDLIALAADLAAHQARVEREVEDIQSLSAPGEPDRTTLWALAGHLQAFTTGCEAILQRAVERFEGLPPHGADSHIRLLQVAALNLPGLRPPIVQAETAAALDPYRAFRHFFRHGYGVELDWSRMAAKVQGIGVVHTRLVRDLAEFSRFLDALASGAS